MRLSGQQLIIIVPSVLGFFPSIAMKGAVSKRVVLPRKDCQL